MTARSSKLRASSEAAPAPPADRRSWSAELGRIARDESCLSIAVGLLISFGLAVLQVRHYRNAGPLWRDEVTSVNVASLPSFGAVLAHSYYDSFPAAWTAILHAWIALGLGNTDLELRRLGLLIGLATIGVLWWSARKLQVGSPLVALLLFAMSPTTIVYGGATVRGYGLGALGILWCMGAVWAFVRAPSARTYLVAQLAAVLAVQTYFGNCFLLLAVCAGGIGVCLGWRAWRRGGAVLAIGVLAALSMLINLPWLLFVSRVSPILRQGDFGLDWWGRMFRESLAPGAPLLEGLWALAAIAAVIGGVLTWRDRGIPVLDEERGRLLYVGIVAVAAVLLYAVYLSLIQIRTHYWYYLPLMAVLGLAFEVEIDFLVGRLRIAAPLRLVGAMLLAIAAARDVAYALPSRMTNIDLIARKVSELGREGDLAVVFPWYCGITFQRYYDGSAPWITIPDFDEHKFHMHALIAEQMKLGDDAIAPQLLRVERTLRSGGRVWVAAPIRAPDGPIAPLPKAPNGPLGWQPDPYLQAWELRIGSLLKDHAREVWVVPLPDVGPVNVWERLPLMVAEGWR